VNQGPLIFLGVLLAMAISWFGLVLGPVMQLGNAQPGVAVSTGDPYPQKRPGDAAQGAELYRSLGCAACHSQQVAWRGYNGDIERGWGNRRSVASDFLFDRTVLLGSQRIGPDLSNIGLRAPGADWLLLHLYDPQAVMPAGAKSVMPPYHFLFETRRAGAKPSPDALKLTGKLAPSPGYEVVPTANARQLVAYLQSLRTDPILFETPVPQVKTNSVTEPGAGAPTATNSPAK
jgi:cytochrome c oxidase cbb3-type subunit II